MDILELKKKEYLKLRTQWMCLTAHWTQKDIGLINQKTCQYKLSKLNRKIQGNKKQMRS